MSLYTSVYWTKRAAVVLGLIIFLCSGFRVFQYVSSNLTVKDTQIVESKAELGFGSLDQITLTPLNTPPEFNPTKFVNSTVTGKYEAENGYPSDVLKTPVANVYKIQDNSIDLNTTEIPRKIAKNLNFAKEPVQTSQTVQVWKDNSRSLEIDGQYLIIKYKNDLAKKSFGIGATDKTTSLYSSSEQIKSVFDTIFNALEITSDLSTYNFTYDYVNYNKATDDFDISTAGQFVRLNATRIYPNLTKVNINAKSEAVYPNYQYSNNYIILPTSMPSGAKYIDYLIAFNLVNWPIIHPIGLSAQSSKAAPTYIIDQKNQKVQTYYIKTPKAAYTELTQNKKYLMSVSNWETKKPIDINLLKDIDKITIFHIKLGMYEDVLNTTYIQPVYVFVSQAEINGQKIQLVYYVPAVLATLTK